MRVRGQSKIFPELPSESNLDLHQTIGDCSLGVCYSPLIQLVQNQSIEVFQSISLSGSCRCDSQLGASSNHFFATT